MAEHSTCKHICEGNRINQNKKVEAYNGTKDCQLVRQHGEGKYFAKGGIDAVVLDGLTIE